jgi:hypothetical protein
MASRPARDKEDGIAFGAFLEDCIFEMKMNLHPNSRLFDVPALWAVADSDIGQPGSCNVDAQIDELNLLITSTIDSLD